MARAALDRGYEYLAICDHTPAVGAVRGLTADDLRRQAIRAAVKIREHLLGPAHSAQQAALPQDAWEELGRTMRRLRYTERRNWQAASQSLLQDFDYTAGRLQREIELLRQNLASSGTPKLVTTASEIAADLIALDDEFESVTLDLKERSATVLTASITLEDVYLGPFRVVLHWEQIGRTRAYVVHAEEPNCPEDRDDVTHPHVQENHLCEGEGAAPIKASLNAGRLLDFFVLIRQILGTYNPESAHISLANWHGGVSCTSCDSTLPRDDYSTCERCVEPLCGSCSSGCDGCSRYVCNECSGDCAQCGNHFCLGCLTSPPGTYRLLCDTCLEAQQKDPSDDTKDEVPPEPPASPTAAAIQPAAPAADPVCVGQTPLRPRPRRNRSGRVRHEQPARPAARRRRSSRAAAVLADDGQV
jgi:hypothetical protein